MMLSRNTFGLLFSMKSGMLSSRAAERGSAGDDDGFQTGYVGDALSMFCGGSVRAKSGLRAGRVTELNSSFDWPLAMAKTQGRINGSSQGSFICKAAGSEDVTEADQRLPLATYLFN